MLYPPSSGDAEADGAAARRLHRALNAHPACRGRACPRPRDEAEVVKEVEVKVEEVVICKLERAVEAAEGKPAAVAGGGERPGVKREREEAGPSGRDGAERQPKRIWGASRFRGVYKDKRARTRPWTAKN